MDRRKFFKALLSAALFSKFENIDNSKELLKYHPDDIDGCATLFQRKVVLLASESIQSEEPEAIASRVCELKDFTGNTYTLVEFSPKGYYIFDNESGLFAEWASGAESPYRECHEKMYYLGVMMYYKEENDIITDLINDTVYALHSADYQALLDKNNEMIRGREEILTSKGNSDLFDETVSVEEYRGLLERRNIERQTRYSDDKWAYYRTFFQNVRVNDFGYYRPPEGAICGYIAISLLLQYWNYRGVIPLYSYYYNNWQQLTIDIYNYWKNLGYPHAINASQVTYILNTIDQIYSFGGNASYATAHIGGLEEIGTSKRPCILKIHLPNGNNHFCIAYGYNMYENTGYVTYRVHMGWRYNGYNDLHLNIVNAPVLHNVKYAL